MSVERLQTLARKENIIAVWKIHIDTIDTNNLQADKETFGLNTPVFHSILHYHLHMKKL